MTHARRRKLLVTALVAIGLLVLIVVSLRLFRPPDGGISQSAAEKIALAQSYSTTPARVTMAHTGHFRDYSHGDQSVPPDTWVWQVSISGTFPPPSCGPIPITPGQKVTCPPDQHSELVVIDYLTGAFLGASIPSPIG
jgi:hypothetical protein